MTKEKKFFRFDDIEATGTSDTELHTTDQNRYGPVSEPGFINSIIEGYALYAAAVFPPLFHADDIARQRDVTLFRHAANEEHAIGTLDAVLDDDAPDLTTDPNPVGEKSRAIRFLGRLGSLLLMPFRFILREREIGRAINMLSAMDDRSLRDIGLHRSQIEHMVRYGGDMD